MPDPSLPWTPPDRHFMDRRMKQRQAVWVCMEMPWLPGGVGTPAVRSSRGAVTAPLHTHMLYSTLQSCAFAAKNSWMHTEHPEPPIHLWKIPDSWGFGLVVTPHLPSLPLPSHRSTASVSSGLKASLKPVNCEVSFEDTQLGFSLWCSWEVNEARRSGAATMDGRGIR